MHCFEAFASYFASIIVVVTAPTTNCFADVFTASSDTYISEHPNLGGPNESHGSDDLMFLIGPVDHYQSCSLIRFDLSSYSGEPIMEDATLNLEVVWTWGGQPQTQSSISIHEIFVEWEEPNVTWNNFGPLPGLQPGVDFDSIALDEIEPLTVNTGSRVSFTVPAGLLQSWIEEPESNFGLIIISQETSSQRDVAFGVAEFGMPANIALNALPGDVNCDGSIDLLDVAPFVNALSTGDFLPNADINGDGSINLLDVGAFVELLAG